MEAVQHTVVQYTHGKTWPTNLVTAREAAVELGIPEERLLELTEAGYAPHWRIDGGPPLYRMPDLKKWGARNLVARCEGRPLPMQVHLDIHLDAVPCLNAPKSIRDISGLVELPCGSAPGVYFLVTGDEVVYVGQSVSPLNRIGTHVNQRGQLFDRVFMIPVPKPMLDAVEGALIRWLRPRLNYTKDGELRAPGQPENDVQIIERLFPSVTKPIQIGGAA